MNDQRAEQAIADGDVLALLTAVVADLEDHADGNVGDGCWALHDKYADLLDRRFGNDRHKAIPQAGSNVCVCGSTVDDLTAHWRVRD